MTLLPDKHGRVTARDGIGEVTASPSAHRLPPLSIQQNKAIATTLMEKLRELPTLSPSTDVLPRSSR